MNYIGSKHKLSGFIKQSIYEVVGKDLEDKVFCDLFSGTGIVARNFKNEVRQIICNDIESYSYVLIRNYIGNYRELAHKEAFIQQLNDLKPKSGFIYKHYCLGGGSGRQYFSDINGQRIDAMRSQIDIWKNNKRIDEDMYYFLLASLIESSDKVANTASVYGAFLKQLKNSARKDLILHPAEYSITNGAHQVYQTDSNQLISRIAGDILYLDPPYNARQYGANYHLLNTIALYDRFVPKGKTGLRAYNRSDYCSKRTVEAAFEELMRLADFKYIFLSYNNEGLMSVDVVKNIMERYGNYKLITTKYQRFRADKKENRNHKADHTEEYLHVLIK